MQPVQKTWGTPYDDALLTSCDKWLDVRESSIYFSNPFAKLLIYDNVCVTC